MEPPAALVIPEVLGQVLECFRPQVPDDSFQIPLPFARDTTKATATKKLTLYRVALTSRMMRDCALPILWSHLRGVAPLLKLLPNLEHDDENEKWALRIAFSGADLLRFDFFAKFINALVFTGVGEQFDLSIFTRIYEYKGREPLLPNLMSLSVPPRCHDYVEAFLHRGLQRLRIQRDKDSFLPRAPLPIISLLREHTPLLQTFRLDGYSPADFDIDPSDVVFLEDLRVVSLRSLDFGGRAPASIQQLLEQLATLPKLSCLYVGYIPDAPGLPNTPLDGQPSTQGVGPRFPALEALWLRGSNNSIIDTLRFLGSQTQTIASLSLKPSGDGLWGSRGPGSGEVLATIANTQFRSLTALRISHWTSLEAVWLEPLFQLSALRCLDMGNTPCSSLNDKFITRLAVSWSQLEVLRLYSSEDGVALSIDCIQIFAKNCPHLISLSLDIDLRHLAYAKVAFSGLLPLPKLMVFSVSRWSKIDNDDEVEFVEQYLRATLPSLQLAYVEMRGWTTFNGAALKEDWDFVFDRIYRRLNPVLQDQWVQFHPSSGWECTSTEELTLSGYRQELGGPSSSW